MFKDESESMRVPCFQLLYQKLTNFSRSKAVIANRKW